MHVKTWHVEIFIFEDEEERRTRAKAVLHTDAGTELHYTGQTRRNPRDPEVPEIGDELATARALSGLAHELLEATAEDISANVQSRVNITG